MENNRTLPYGEQWLTDTASTNDKKFTTYQRDSESGLDYAMNRYDSNTNGRFMSVDKGKAQFFVPVTLSRYIYTADDPINYTDPGGKFISPIEPEPWFPLLVGPQGPILELPVFEASGRFCLLSKLPAVTEIRGGKPPVAAG